MAVCREVVDGNKQRVASSLNQSRWRQYCGVSRRERQTRETERERERGAGEPSDGMDLCLSEENDPGLQKEGKRSTGEGARARVGARARAVGVGLVVCCMHATDGRAARDRLRNVCTKDVCR